MRLVHAAHQAALSARVSSSVKNVNAGARAAPAQDMYSDRLTKTSRRGAKSLRRSGASEISVGVHTKAATCHAGHRRAAILFWAAASNAVPDAGHGSYPFVLSPSFSDPDRPHGWYSGVSARRLPERWSMAESSTHQFASPTRWLAAEQQVEFTAQSLLCPCHIPEQREAERQARMRTGDWYADYMVSAGAGRRAVAVMRLRRLLTSSVIGAVRRASSRAAWRRHQDWLRVRALSTRIWV